MRPCRASVRGLLVGLTTRNRWNIRLPASWPWRWPWFVPDMRVWTGLIGRCSVRRICLMWSRGGSPAAGFRSWLLLPFGEKVGMRGGSCAVLHFLDWLGRQVARLRRAFAGLPASEFLLFAGPKRRNQEKWPVEPADPTSPVGRGVGNRQGTSCSTGGHTAPSPFTEAREGLPRMVALRLLPPDRAVRSGLVYRLPHRMHRA
jgi:hypothetical protein